MTRLHPYRYRVVIGLALLFFLTAVAGPAGQGWAVVVGIIWAGLLALADRFDKEGDS